MRLKDKVAIVTGAGTGIGYGLAFGLAKEGEYFLVCLPLKVVGIDGAPARAVLMENERCWRS